MVRTTIYLPDVLHQEIKHAAQERGTRGRALARAAVDVGLPTDLETAHVDAATFLDPILAGATTGR